MSRAIWKGPYIDVKNFHKLKKKNSYIINRNSKIIPRFLGSTFLIHNGKSYIEITVSDSMIGHKFGEFVFTRTRYIFKKKNQKN